MKTILLLASALLISSCSLQSGCRIPENNQKVQQIYSQTEKLVRAIETKYSDAVFISQDQNYCQTGSLYTVNYSSDEHKKNIQNTLEANNSLKGRIAYKNEASSTH